MQTEYYDKNKHREVIEDFLRFLNSQSQDYVLKGGTALMLCYKLDRFSEDVDLDGRNYGIEQFINSFCEEKGFTYRVAKDTAIVKRFFIHYGSLKPLKIEISYRQMNLDKESRTTQINGIKVYNIDEMMNLKLGAYNGRDRIRDLYDIVFIYKNYKESLSENTILSLANSLSEKGFAHFDYITQTQKDDLIDTDRLANDFLDTFDSLGLLVDKDDISILKESGVKISNLKKRKTYEFER
ncbi:MAG: nucleotidyl transferase AbiEii/AbiGii toxin family protein [Erysipelotrichaceae bacterium]|nr:nucleotidyl transferase AbiEii/AbiGii toxin family protein [Erysipelotrichaceae bacterium]